jgi:hypothetical protein
MISDTDRSADQLQEAIILSYYQNCPAKTISSPRMAPPLLQYHGFKQPFLLTADATNEAFGAILSQGPIGKDLPIAYAR